MGNYKYFNNIQKDKKKSKIHCKDKVIQYMQCSMTQYLIISKHKD